MFVFSLILTILSSAVASGYFSRESVCCYETSQFVCKLIRLLRFQVYQESVLSQTSAVALSKHLTHIQPRPKNRTKRKQIFFNEATKKQTKTNEWNKKKENTQMEVI